MVDASNRIRAMINDHRQKDGAYGTDRIPVCLDSDLVNEYNRVLNEKTVAEKEAERDKRRTSDRRMSEPAGGDKVAELDARLEELRAEIEAASFEMIFRAMGDDSWSKFRSEHPNTSDEDDQIRDKALDKYFDAMLEKCFVRVEFDGEATDLKLHEIIPPSDQDGILNFPQAQDVRARVQALNVRSSSVPFSLSTSKKRPKTSPKSRRPRASASATDAS
jgi:hypothetical protein